MFFAQCKSCMPVLPTEDGMETAGARMADEKLRANTHQETFSDKIPTSPATTICTTLRSTPLTTQYTPMEPLDVCLLEFNVSLSQ